MTQVVTERSGLKQLAEESARVESLSKRPGAKQELGQKAFCGVIFNGNNAVIPPSDFTQLPAQDWFPAYTNPAADVVLPGAPGPHMEPLYTGDELNGRIRVTPSAFVAGDPPAPYNNGTYLIQAWGGWNLSEPLWGGQVGIKIQRLDFQNSTFTRSYQDHWTNADILSTGSDELVINVMWLTQVETSQATDSITFYVDFYQDSAEDQVIMDAALMIQHLDWFEYGTTWV